MDPVSVLIDKMKGAAKSSERFVNGAIRKCSIYSKHDPVEILKRLQQEAFSDIMKLRDRQDKTERVLSLFKSTKMGPFQEATTHIKGMIDFLGSIVLVEDDSELTSNALGAGIRTGIDLRFIFRTSVRQKDKLIAGFAARQNSLVKSENACSPLAFEKLMYIASMNDWLSVILSPVGAHCNELGLSSCSQQDNHVGNTSLFSPPLFNQQYNCGAGVVFNGSDFATSLAELVSSNKSLNTFAQVAYQPFQDTRLTLSCLWQMPKSKSRFLKFVTQNGSNSADQSSSSESYAIMLDAELDESSRVNGWVELRNSNKVMQWGTSLSDLPDNELGWGLRMGGKNEGSSKQLHVEGFLNFCLGRKFNLQPGLVYATDGRNRSSALVFRSSCFM